MNPEDATITAKVILTQPRNVAVVSLIDDLRDEALRLNAVADALQLLTVKELSISVPLSDKQEPSFIVRNLESNQIATPA